MLDSIFFDETKPPIGVPATATAVSSGFDPVNEPTAAPCDAFSADHTYCLFHHATEGHIHIENIDIIGPEAWTSRTRKKLGRFDSFFRKDRTLPAIIDMQRPYARRASGSGLDRQPWIDWFCKDDPVFSQDFEADIGPLPRMPYREPPPPGRLPMRLVRRWTPRRAPGGNVNCRRFRVNGLSPILRPGGEDGALLYAGVIVRERESQGTSRWSGG